MILTRLLQAGRRNRTTPESSGGTSIIRKLGTPVISRVDIDCDRLICSDTGHPRHTISVITTWHGVGSVQYRTELFMAGHRVRVPWNFSNQADALTHHNMLIGSFETLAEAAAGRCISNVEARW